MATLMIYTAKSRNIAGDAEKSERGCWKKGMVVRVFEDGVCTEPPAPDSRMGFIHVPGWEARKAEKYMEQAQEAALGEDESPRVLKRRKFIFDYSEMPGSIKRGLRDFGEVTTTKAKVKKTIRNQIDGILESTIVDLEDPIDPVELAEALAEGTEE